jgi:hypothetical protein
VRSIASSASSASSRCPSAFGDAAPLLRKRPCGIEEGGARGVERGLELDDAILAALEIGQLAAKNIAARHDIGQRRPVFPFQALEQRQPLLELLELAGDASMPSA